MDEDCRRRSRIAPTSWCFEAYSTSLEEAHASPNRVRDSSSKGETWRAFALSCFLSHDLLSSKTTLPKEIRTVCQNIKLSREIDQRPSRRPRSKMKDTLVSAWVDEEKEAILPRDDVTMKNRKLLSTRLLSPLLALASERRRRCRANRRSVTHRRALLIRYPVPSAVVALNEALSSRAIVA